MLTLIKLSDPGWEKQFATEGELKSELYKHICGICRKGGEDKYYHDGEEIVWEELPIAEDSPLEDMLASACGCEYDVEM